MSLLTKTVATTLTLGLAGCFNANPPPKKISGLVTIEAQATEETPPPLLIRHTCHADISLDDCLVGVWMISNLSEKPVYFSQDNGDGNEDYGLMNPQDDRFQIKTRPVKKEPSDDVTKETPVMRWPASAFDSIG